MLYHGKLDNCHGAVTTALTDDEDIHIFCQKHDKKSMAIFPIYLFDAHFHHVASATNACYIWRSLLVIFDC